jgi:DNA-binding transcriptional ArsR family regulator
MPPIPPLPGDAASAPPVGRVFHALADPTRMAIVEQLSRGPASVSELARPLAISLPGVLQHIAVLEGDGLVRSEKVGRVRTCRIEPAALRAAGDWVAQRREMWERSFDRLGDYLAEQDDRAAGRQTEGAPARGVQAQTQSAPTRGAQANPKETKP